MSFLKIGRYQFKEDDNTVMCDCCGETYDRDDCHVMESGTLCHVCYGEKETKWSHLLWSKCDEFDIEIIHGLCVEIEETQREQKKW